MPIKLRYNGNFGQVISYPVPARMAQGQKSAIFIGKVPSFSPHQMQHVQKLKQNLFGPECMKKCISFKSFFCLCHELNQIWKTLLVNVN